jgi:hypothetical protein
MGELNSVVPSLVIGGAGLHTNQKVDGAKQPSE